MKSKITAISFTFIALFVFYSNSYAEVYEYQFTPSSSIDPSGFAHYMLYIPENIDIIKGVYCYVPGWQGSSLDQVDNTYYQEYAKGKGFALMGFKMLGAYTDYNIGVSLWSGKALITALKELSTLSSHPELEYSALLFDGHSAGGQFSYHFTQWKPERVIAFASIKGGYHSLAPAGNAIKVPGYMFIGENDLGYRISNLTTIFETNRLDGAVWALAMEPNSDHQRVSYDIIHSYFDQIIPLRIPDNIPLNSIPDLIEMEEQTGWLGNRQTYNIELYSDYAGDMKDACWFPNEKIAKEWQNFVQGLPLSLKGLPCKNNKLKVYPNPASSTIHIEYSGILNDDINYKILNLTGQIVRQSKSKGNIIDDIELKDGIYILNIYIYDKIISNKIVIE